MQEFDNNIKAIIILLDNNYIEIKYSTSFDKKCLHAIDMFKEKHKAKGLNIPFSLIIYRGEYFTPRKDVFCLPVWALC